MSYKRVKKNFSAPSEWLIFLDFYLIRKYTKYSLNLTFGWECNDTPSLIINSMKINKIVETLNYRRTLSEFLFCCLRIVACIIRHQIIIAIVHRTLQLSRSRSHMRLSICMNNNNNVLHHTVTDSLKLGQTHGGGYTTVDEGIN